MPQKMQLEGRILRSAFVASAVTAAVVLLAAKANVVWHDRWCTPRWTPYNILFWGIRDSIGQLLLPLALCGIAGLVVSSAARQRWEVWGAVLLTVVALYHMINTP